jgi:hypothetical protein
MFQKADNMYIIVANQKMEEVPVKVIGGIFIGIIAVVVLLVLVAGYFGFVPGLSNIMGSNKPVNLGTSYTAADYRSAAAKTGTQFLDNTDTVNYNKSQKTFGPARAVTADFTASEITAALNDKPHPADFPVKDWQVRYNPDGTAEISAVVLLDNASSYAASHGVSNDAIQQVLDAVKKFGVIEKEIPIYLKGSFIVVNGVLDFDATSVKIGRLPVSADTLNSNKASILDFRDTHKNDIPGFSCKNASIINGKLHFEGTFPSTVALKK